MPGEKEYFTLFRLPGISSFFDDILFLLKALNQFLYFARLFFFSCQFSIASETLAFIRFSALDPPFGHIGIDDQALAVFARE